MHLILNEMLSCGHRQGFFALKNILQGKRKRKNKRVNLKSQKYKSTWKKQKGLKEEIRMRKGKIMRVKITDKK